MQRTTQIATQGAACQQPALSCQELRAEVGHLPSQRKNVTSRKHILPLNTTTLPILGVPGCLPCLRESSGSSSSPSLLGGRVSRSFPSKNKRRNRMWRGLKELNIKVEEMRGGFSS